MWNKVIDDWKSDDQKKEELEVPLSVSYAGRGKSLLQWLCE